MTDFDAGAAEARFDFGRVVGQTFGLIGRNFVLFLIMALIFVGAPQFGILYYQALAMQDPSQAMLIMLGGTLVNLVATYILQGALTRAAVDDLSGKGVSFGAAIGDGLRYFFPLFVMALLAGIGMMLGFLLLIVPGLILAVRWILAAPIVVIERVGPTNSLGRSAELTEKHRWAIFGLILLYLVFAYAVQIILGVALAAGGGGSAMDLLLMEGTGLVFALITAAVTAVITLVSTVGTAVLYFELRRVKEGVGVAELAAVFD